MIFCSTAKYRAASRRTLATLVAASLALSPAAGPSFAQNLPNLGDESANVLSPQMERRIGESYYRELRRDPSYLDDPEIKAYIEELGAQLIAAGPEPGLDVEFFMIRDGTINAFAMLGGFIGVNSGLLLAAQSESEAASVLAHELGHLTQKHIARSVSAGQRASVVSMVALAVALLAARSNGQVAAGAVAGAQAFQVQQQLAYSRDFEREADRVGFDTLQKAGFDVSAMAAFFERLQRAGRIYESNAPVYVRSHPLTTERIADVRNRIQGTRYRQRADSQAFQLARAKLRATLDPSVDGIRDAVRFFETQLNEKSYASQSAATYGHAEALLLARDYQGADTALSRMPADAVHPMIDGLKARIRLAAGDIAGAIAVYRGAVKKFPRVRHLQVALAGALQTDGRHDETLAMLRDQLQSYRNDARLYEMQARSFAATGKLMSQHQALGEYYALVGSPQAAIEQFQIARCAGGGDFYQQSIIDSRIRVLWDQAVSERADRGESGKGGGAAPAAGPGGRGQHPALQAPGRCGPG